MLGKNSTFLLSVASLLIISTQSFALQIYKGHTVKHKEWSTGNLKANFKDSFVKKDFMQQKLLRGDESSYASINSSATNAEGKVNSPVSISGYHNVYAFNNTQSIQSIHYTLVICAETSQHTANCSFYYDQIELEAGGYVVSDKEPILEVNFDKPGIYRSTAGAYLMIQEDGKMFATSSNSESKVSIS